jgi:putative protease
MRIVRKIELLAPAKNKEAGIEAVNHGADAVYIGAPKFSARSAAGNSIEDIRELVKYAHVFHAKVYVALNTILKNSELEETQEMIWKLYRQGVDALIIQDMGILNLSLPPIALHASTQTDNRTLEKVRFFEKTGFSRVVLARELTVKEIKNIAAQTQISLEVFVHGALCTSYSGQCYISQAFTGRSANRGECAQFCRLPYNLQDGEGNIIVRKKHLLSLKDLNQSSNLEELLDAGVSSLKIEGRLKDISYVKNITAYYRQKLDAIFEHRPEYIASSSGKSTFFFSPDPNKSFNRDFTTYFLHGRSKDMASIHSPKSRGEAVGNIQNVHGNYFTIRGRKPIHNGDGLCFVDEKKELQGFRVNKVDGNKVYPADMPELNSGIPLYRNHDQEFEKLLSQKSAERKITVDFILEENNFGFSLSAFDEDNYSATITGDIKKELSLKDQKENILLQLSKLGNTAFRLHYLENRLKENWFVPSSLLSEMKRKVIENLLKVREISIKKPLNKVQANSYPFPQDSLSYLGNVYNEKAKEFYCQHGVKRIEDAFETNTSIGKTLMFSRYCIKYQLEYCPKQENRQTFKEPFILTANSHKLLLHFDCNNCEMQVSWLERTNND